MKILGKLHKKNVKKIDSKFKFLIIISLIFVVEILNYQDNFVKDQISIINKNLTKLTFDEDLYRRNFTQSEINEYKLNNHSIIYDQGTKNDIIFCEILSKAKNFILVLNPVWSIFSKNGTKEIQKISTNLPMIEYQYFNWYPDDECITKWYNYQKATFDYNDKEFIMSGGKYKFEVLFVKNGKIIEASYNFVLQGGEKYLRDIIKFYYPLFIN